MTSNQIMFGAPLTNNTGQPSAVIQSIVSGNKKMGFFAKLFNKSTEPVHQYEDARLGIMIYQQDDDTWVGHYNGYEYRISYDHQSVPQKELLRYCFDTLSKKQWLVKNLRRLKDIRKVGANAHYSQEIEALQYISLMFYRYCGELRILVQLSNDQDERLWRIEFFGDKCQGLDFDI